MGFKNFTFNLAKVAKIFALCAFLVSCTEEVAEELKNKASSDPLSNNTDDLTKASMRLVHKMDETFSYRLHAAGSQTAPCKISPPDEDGFDPTTYYKDPSAGPAPQVVDCILEAQENDLYQQGANLELQVDGQLCEYISYQPFKFVEMVYGDTIKTIYKVECTASEDLCGTGGRCDSYFKSQNSAATDPASKFDTNNIISASQALSCQFDYSNTNYGENCDEGGVRVVTYRIDNSPIDSDSDGTPDSCEAIGDMDVTNQGEDEIACGGEHEACMGGPAVEYFGDQTTTSRIFTNTDLGEFTEEFEIQAPIDRQDEGPWSNHNNMYIANFSRICANNDSSKSYASGYTGYSFEGHESETLKDSFRTMYVDENGVELFRYYDGSMWYYDNVNQDGADACDFNSGDGTYVDCAEFDYRSYAENPWRALHTTSPYYAFKCRDQAFDVKAQIRLFIRDWDRDFSLNQTAFSVVSDVGVPTSLMDNYGAQDGDDWNDKNDWDDWFGDGFTWENNQCTATNTDYEHSSALFPGNL